MSSSGIDGLHALVTAELRLPAWLHKLQIGP